MLEEVLVGRSVGVWRMRVGFQGKELAVQVVMSAIELFARVIEERDGAAPVVFVWMQMRAGRIG